MTGLMQDAAGAAVFDCMKSSYDKSMNRYLALNVAAVCWMKDELGSEP